jgi:hypothetical protein
VPDLVKEPGVKAACQQPFDAIAAVAIRWLGNRWIIRIIKRMVTTGPTFRWCMSGEPKYP